MKSPERKGSSRKDWQIVPEGLYGDAMVPEHVSRLLTAYVDGELRPQQRRSVEQMLLRSPEARAFLQSLQKDAAEIRDLPHVAAARDFGPEVLRKLGRAAVVPALLPFASKRPPAAWFRHTIAASILLGAALGTAFYIATRIVPVDFANKTEEGLELPPPYVPESGRLLAKNESKEIHGFAEPMLERPPLTGLAQPRPPASRLRFNPEVLTTQFEAAENLKTPLVAVPFIVRLKKINSEQAKLQKELSLGDGHRVDVYDADLSAALAALHSGLKTIGTDLLDQDANVQLGLGLKTDVAVFLESVNPKDLTRVLGHLCPDGTKDSARLANGSLVVSDLTTDGQGKLLNPPEVGATRPKDVKSLKVKAEMDAIRAAFAKSAHRTAVALAFEPSRLHEFFLPPHFFSDSPGNIQALIILHARK